MPFILFHVSFPIHIFWTLFLYILLNDPDRIWAILENLGRSQKSQKREMINSQLLSEEPKLASVSRLRQGNRRISWFYFISFTLN